MQILSKILDSTLLAEYFTPANVDLGGVFIKKFKFIIGFASGEKLEANLPV